jgi:hypothetical protein
MNEPVVQWCRDQGLEVTRSRAYRKNDQAWVEQKNGAIVRRLVGYGRLRSAGRRRVDTGSDPAVRGGAAAHEPVPALVQAAAEDAHRRACDQAVSRTGVARRPGSRARRRRRGEQTAGSPAPGTSRSGAADRGHPRCAARPRAACRSPRPRRAPAARPQPTSTA